MHHAVFPSFNAAYTAFAALPPGHQGEVKVVDEPHTTSWQDARLSWNGDAKTFVKIVTIYGGELEDSDDAGND